MSAEDMGTLGPYVAPASSRLSQIRGVFDSLVSQNHALAKEMAAFKDRANTTTFKSPDTTKFGHLRSQLPFPSPPPAAKSTARNADDQDNVLARPTGVSGAELELMSITPPVSAYKPTFEPAMPRVPVRSKEQSAMLEVALELEISRRQNAEAIKEQLQESLRSSMQQGMERSHIFAASTSHPSAIGTSRASLVSDVGRPIVLVRPLNQTSNVQADLQKEPLLSSGAGTKIAAGASTLSPQVDVEVPGGAAVDASFEDASSVSLSLQQLQPFPKLISHEAPRAATVNRPGPRTPLRRSKATSVIAELETERGKRGYIEGELAASRMSVKQLEQQVNKVKLQRAQSLVRAATVESHAAKDEHALLSDISALQREVSSLKNENAQYASLLQERAERIQGLTMRLQSSRADAEKAQFEMRRAQADLSAVEEQATRAKSECGTLRNKITQLEECNAALLTAERRSLEHAELRTSRLEAENKSLMLTLSEADKHLARLTAALTSAELRETKLREHMSILQDEHKAGQHKLQQSTELCIKMHGPLQQEALSSREKSEWLQQNLASLELEVTKLRQQVVQHQQELTHVKLELQNKCLDAAQLARYNSNLQAALQRAEHAVSTAQAHAAPAVAFMPIESLSMDQPTVTTSFEPTHTSASEIGTVALLTSPKVVQSTMRIIPSGSSFMTSPSKPAATASAMLLSPHLRKAAPPAPPPKVFDESNIRVERLHSNQATRTANHRRIISALSTIYFAGPLGQERLKAIKSVFGSYSHRQLVIGLLSSSSRSNRVFAGVYVVVEEDAEAISLSNSHPECVALPSAIVAFKAVGTGPTLITSVMVHTCLKYDTAAKEFREVGSGGTLTITTDAVCVDTLHAVDLAASVAT